MNKSSSVENSSLHEKNSKNSKQIIKTQKLQKNYKNIKNPKNNNSSTKSSLILTNIRGLIPGTRQDKLKFIQAMAEELSTDLILLTETHLTPKIESSEISMEGWQEIRSDRLSRQNGGSIIYLKDSLTVTDQQSYSNEFVEMSMGFIPKQETAVIVIYRPPSCPEDKFNDAILFLSKWIKTIEDEIERTPLIVLGGDLNFPFLHSWSGEDIEDVTANSSARSDNNNAVGSERLQALKMIELMSDFSLNQEVTEGTRGSNILDVLFSNDDDLIEDIEVIENMQMSDHKFFIANLSKVFNLDNDVSKKRNNYCFTDIPDYDLYKPAPEVWAKAKEQFSLIEFNNEDDIETLTNKVINSLETVVKDNFPPRAPPDRKNLRSKSLIPREVRTLMKRKINANRSLAKATEETKINDLKDKILNIEDELRLLVHKRRAQAEMKARHNLKSDPLAFFTLVKKLTKKSAKVGPFKRTKDNINLSDAEILSNQYKKVFTSPDEEHMFDSPEDFFKSSEDFTESKLSSFTICQESVAKAIDSLPTKAAPGPDGIPPILLKQLKWEITPVLNLLFQKSVESGEIPNQFLTAFVKPIRKPKKKRSEPSSYRPVSLTSNLAKVLEHILKIQIQDHIEGNNLINSSQHGFRKSRSCLTQLLSHYDSILKSLEAGAVHDVVYLDFEKAFDSVDRYILSHEMKKICITDTLVFGSTTSSMDAPKESSRKTTFPFQQTCAVGCLRGQSSAPFF